MLDMRARRRVSRAFDPIARVFARFGFSPSGVTLLGVAIAIGGGVLIGLGHLGRGFLAVGGAVAGFGATLDVLDGILARLTHRETRRGAFLDSVTDRIGEVAMWTGLAYYLASEGRALLVMLCLVAASGSLLISLIRARAEAEGMQGKGGLMGRAERILVFCWGVGLAGVGVGDPWLLIATISVLAVLTWVTVLQRFYNTWVQLKA